MNAPIGVLFLASVFFSLPTLATGQDPSPSPSASASPSPASRNSYDQLSLEELLQVPISVATKSARPIREVPGVVTLVTRDQITSSGARDLIDVLALVPGIAFGNDTEGLVSLGFRGNWGEEGKVLLLVDGIDMNDLLYLNLPLGNRIPVERIERVEVIRGSGSVIYGGSAELAVINIVTRGPDELDGARVTSASLGASARSPSTLLSHGRRSGTFAYGQRAPSENGLAWSIAGSAGEALRSDVIYHDLFGGSFDMADETTLDETWLDGTARWRGLKVKALFENYVVHDRSGYDVIFLENVSKTFRTFAGSAEYEWKLGDTLRVTPRLLWKRQTDWATFHESPDSSYYDPVVARYEGGLIAQWMPRPGLDVLVGTTENEDEYWLASNANGDRQKTLLDQLFGGRTIADTSSGNIPVSTRRNFNGAVYAQVVWDNPIANLSAGARVDQNDHFGGSFEPRVALTKVFGDFHAKLLASKGFRPPSAGDLDYNPALKPERSTSFEVEGGWRISEGSLVTANIFDVSIDGPMLYTYAVNGTGNYFNFGSTGSIGAEVVAQTSLGHGASIVATYSYYSAAGKNRVSDYAVPGHGDLMLAFSHHKATASLNAPPIHDVRLGATAIFYGERYGYDALDGAGNPALLRFPPILLANLIARWHHNVGRGLDVTLGLYNALGSRFSFIEPYDGAHPAIPGEPREGVLRVEYAF